MKKIISTMFLLVLMVAVFGCKSSSSNETVLTVTSHDYKGLKELYAAEIDEEAVGNWSLMTLNPYYGYICHVALRNDELYVSSEWEYQNSFTVMGNCGYFVGVDLGEFDGWVRYHSYDKDEPILVVNENCRGFVKVDNDTAYLFTGFCHIFHDEGAVYKLSFSPEYDESSCVKIADLSGNPLVYTYNKVSQTVYVATTKELLAVSLVDNSITTLSDISLWEHSGATSIVEHNGKLYVGFCMGIYEYDLETKKVMWYPMDYEKYVEKQQT